MLHTLLDLFGAGAPFDLVAWLKAFLFTQIVEAPIYRWAVPATWRNALLASTITHPFVWFLFPYLTVWFGIAWVTTAIVSEIFAWVVEAVFHKRVRSALSWRRAFLVSLVANGTSVSLGLLVRELTGWV